MKVQFLTPLRVERAGACWRLVAEFLVKVLAAETESVYSIPGGYETDFASVPRLPLAFLFAGDTAHRSAVLHDYLLSTGADRSFADRVFLAAMVAEGVPWWRRRLMHAAVRAYSWAS